MRLATFHKLVTLLFAITLTNVVAHAQINPASQINWPRLVGAGAAPTGSCTSLNYGQPYENSSSTTFNYYICGAGGWEGPFDTGPLAPNQNSSTGFRQSQGAGISVQFGLHASGDSNTIGYDLQGTGQSHIPQICQDLGVPTNRCINNAVQGNDCADVAYFIARTELTNETQNPVQLVECGSNESDTGTENTANQYLGQIQSELFIGSYLLNGPSEEVFAFANGTLTGSYATDSTTFLSSKGVKTTTTGTVTIPINVGINGVMYCWVYEYASSTGIYQIQDVTMPTATNLTDTILNTNSFTSQGLARNPVNEGTTWPGALRFTGLTPGYHLIRQNVTTSGPTGFIGCVSQAGPVKHGIGAPNLMLSNTIPEQYNNYSVAVADTNATIKQVWTYLINDGFNLVPWDVHGAVNYTSDFDSKSVIGFTVTSVGSGQTNGTYTEQAATYTCASSTIPYMTYTIAGGVLVAPPVPTGVQGASYSFAVGCTAATWTIAHGGTPATVVAVLSTNAGYNSYPPYHLSQNGHNHVAMSAEALLQASAMYHGLGSVGTGSTTVGINTSYYDATGAATLTFPNGAGTMNPGQCVAVTQGGTTAASIITIAGGSGGNAAGQTVAPGSGYFVCSYDNTGLVTAVRDAIHQYGLNEILASATTSLGATTLFNNGGETALYRVNYSATCDSVKSSGTIIGKITYTDPSSTAQTITTATATCTTLGASSYVQASYLIRAKIATNVQISTTVANAPTYDLNVVSEILTVQ